MYSELVKESISACRWDTTDFLVISENVFDPFIYYSHAVPLFISITIGFFVLYKNRYQLLSIILFFITSLFSLWVFFDLILWATDKPHFTMFFWSVVNLIEPFIYAASLYFVQVFITGKDTSLKTKILTVLPLVPFVLLISTSFTLVGYDLSNCNREAIEGPLTHYAYIVEVFYTLWIVIFVMENYRKCRDSLMRKQMLLLALGVIFFLLSFSFGNIVGTITDDWRVPQWGLFGMPVFIAFISYLIVKYRALDIKLMATQALAVMMSILIGSQFFFVRNFGNHVLSGVAFIISVVGGILLVRSVRLEIESRQKVELQKQEIEVVNKKLKMANDRLKDLNKQKTEFVSFASHQLRSPLTAIKGYASLLLDGDYGVIGDEAKKAVQIVFDSAKTLTSVVDDYLNVTRIELGQMKYNFSLINLEDVVTESINELKPNIRKAGLEIIFTGSEDRCLVMADKEKIKQVIINILDNAIKYTQKGCINIKILISERNIVLSIKDTGVGISSENIKKLFNKFSRADTGGKINTKGTGLGLFIAREIVLAHGGDIKVESSGESLGSEFIISLPKSKSA